MSTPASVLGSGGGSGSGSGGSPQGPPVFDSGDLIADRWQVRCFLARGGMGEVYEVEDRELGQIVALKTVTARLGMQQQAIDRFKREIALARLVTHPNVCRIFDLGQHVGASGQDTIFLTMELLRGETLADHLALRGRLPVDEARVLALQIASALDAAHGAGIVHRDLKTENIFLVPAEDSTGAVRAVVTDFGVARGSSESDSLAARVTGPAIVGTPAYMAPEQVEGGAIGPSADLYAFGVVLFEMVTGRLPFEGRSPLSTAVKRLQEDPPSPQVHAPDLPQRWEQTILRCLERAPQARFPSAGEVAAALTEPVAAPSTVVPSPTSMPTGTPTATPTATDGTPAQVPSGSTPAPSPAAPPQSAASLPSSAAPTPTSTVTPAALESTAAAGTPTDDSAPPARSRLRWLVALLLVVGALSAGLALLTPDDELAPGRVQPRRSVAVLGFENLGDGDDKAWLSTAVSEMLATELAREGALRAVSNDRVETARRQLGLTDGASPSEAQLAELHGMLGCDYVVNGSYIALPGGGDDESLRLDLRLRDAAVGSLVASLSETGTTGELFAMVDRLGSGLFESLGIDAAQGDDPFSGLPRDPQAASLYAQALDALRDGDPETARRLLDEALRIEPDNPLLHSAQSATWTALGYGGRAAEAARQAFERSSRLPREDRLAIEGRFREAQGEWLQATEVYTELWTTFPDELDYGLRLVNAQTAAAQPADALATVERLRQLPPPLGDDPRIDLSAAEAAAALGRADLQLEAASRAAQAAAARGVAAQQARAELLAAQAQRRRGELEAASLRARTALELYETSRLEQGVAGAVTALANLDFDQGRLDAADAGYRRAEDIHRRLGDRGGIAASLNNRAVLAKRRGALDRAQDLYEQAEAEYREVGDRRGLLTTANNRAVVLVDRDRLDEALDAFESARTGWQELGGGLGLAYSLNNTAEVQRLQGNLNAAQAGHEQALALRREAGATSEVAASLGALARVRWLRGDLEGAEALLAEADGLVAQVDEPALRAQITERRADLAAERGALERATTLYAEALASRQRLGEEARTVDSLLGLTRAALEQARAQATEDAEPAPNSGDGSPPDSNIDTAAEHARAALEVARTAGLPSAAAEAGGLLALCYHARGDAERARAMLDQAADLGSPRPRVAWELRLARILVDTPADAAERLETLAAEARTAGDEAMARTIERVSARFEG